MFMNISRKEVGVLILLSILVLSSMSIFVLGDPTGATVTFESNTSKNSSTADNRTDPKGTITTLTLDAEQQNLKWKAYVGNVTSTFVLDDEDDYSIYRWSVNSFTGQVYIVRNDTVDWGSVNCSNTTHKENEDTALGHTSTSTDSINSTFVTLGHKAFTIGTSSIPADDCYATATYINDTVQVASSTTPFTEVMLYDSTYDNTIYTTFVENDISSYRADNIAAGALGLNITYDFQAIVPETNNPSEPRLNYYFYIELFTS
jgi:hypothetical protein